MKKQLLTFILLSLAMFGLHTGINLTLPNPLLFISLIAIHTTLLIIFTLGIYVLNLINEIDHEKVGITFLGLSTIKMLIALSFILVQIKVFKKPNTVAYHFLIIYFIDLVFISLVTLKILQNNNYSKKEE